MTINIFKNLFKRKTTKEKKFLNDFVFKGLEDLNTGFDVPSIHYFSEEDFEIALKRLENYGVILYGIEPWLDGEFYDVISYEEYNLEPENFEWVYKAMDEFKSRGLNLQYAASYLFPDGIPKTK